MVPYVAVSVTVIPNKANGRMEEVAAMSASMTCTDACTGPILAEALLA